jgi:hypothetical protein
MIRLRPPAPVLAAVAGYAAAQALGRTAGSRRSDRHRPLPGDALVARPATVTNHAVTIEAAPDEVWPWLTQMGWHLGGWYTPRWVDRVLFPANRPSAARLAAELARDLRVGDTIPDGPPGTAWFAVTHVEPPHLLVLHSGTHLPRSWRERHGARIDWAWMFSLTPEGSGRTRLLVRTRAQLAPAWVRAAYVAAVVPADGLMATGMLRGIKRRVEHTSGPAVSTAGGAGGRR